MPLFIENVYLDASLTFSSSHQYHSGGVGGLGLLFARLAAASHVRRLILLDINQNFLHSLPADLQSPESVAEVTVKQNDTASKEAAESLGSQRVDGLIHAAGVLRDALFLKQTASSFRAVLSGKVRLFSGNLLMRGGGNT